MEHIFRESRSFFYRKYGAIVPVNPEHFYSKYGPIVFVNLKHFLLNMEQFSANPSTFWSNIRISRSHEPKVFFSRLEYLFFLKI